jgi:hypothetical protein
MKKIIFTSLFLIAFSCKTLSPSVKEGGEKVVDCAKDSIAEIAKDNISNVQLELLQDDWKNLLLKDASRLGSDVLACVVEFIVSSSRRDSSSAASDENARSRKERGQAWLDGEKVLFQRKLQP